MAPENEPPTTAHTSDTADRHQPEHPGHTLPTRRELIAGGGLLALGAGLDHTLTGTRRAHPAPTSERASTVAFYAAHQAGIATPAQDYLHFAAFDLTDRTLEALRDLLQQWTTAAVALTAGQPYQPTSQQSNRPPSDPGEAIELGASRLTLTFGFGPSLFGTPTADPVGLAHLRPAMLRPLPAFTGESLDPARSNGDLCIQACANDPQVAFHAIHLLARIAGDTAALRWSQLGFGRTSSTSRTQRTPRNLMGFKDGTDNIRAEETTAMNRYVWVQPSDQPTWMRGGTYLVARRIEILLDVWDSTTLEDQQRTIGRAKLSGAPLGSRQEYDPPQLNATENGEPAIPENAHIRLANPQNNNQQRILRRGYSYTETAEPNTGEINAGLFFIAYQRDPDRQFIPLQHKLAANDALNRHTLHTASAIFACPPGIAPTEFIGSQLFS